MRSLVQIQVGPRRRAALAEIKDPGSETGEYSRTHRDSTRSTRRGPCMWAVGRRTADGELCGLHDGGRCRCLGRDRHRRPDRLGDRGTTNPLYAHRCRHRNRRHDPRRRPPASRRTCTDSRRTRSRVTTLLHHGLGPQATSFADVSNQPRIRSVVSSGFSCWIQWPQSRVTTSTLGTNSDRFCACGIGSRSP